MQLWAQTSGNTMKRDSGWRMETSLSRHCGCPPARTRSLQRPMLRPPSRKRGSLASVVEEPDDMEDVAPEGSGAEVEEDPRAAADFSLRGQRLGEETGS